MTTCNLQPANSNLQRIRLLGIVFLIVACLASPAAAQTAKFDIKLPKSTTLGESVIMLARLSNTTGYRLMVDFGVEDQTEFVFNQTLPDGTSVRVQPSLVPPNRMRTSHLMLRATTQTVAVVLDQWMKFPQPGRYQIDVEYRGSVAIDGGNEAKLTRTARFLMDVKPRDPKRLEKRANDWMKQVSTLSPSRESRTATVALTVMTDPVVIPFLELAAIRTRSARFIDALAAMKTAEAASALNRLAQTQDPDVRGMALKALTNIARKSS